MAIEHPHKNVRDVGNLIANTLKDLEPVLEHHRLAFVAEYTGPEDIDADIVILPNEMKLTDLLAVIQRRVDVGAGDARG